MLANETLASRTANTDATIFFILAGSMCGKGHRHIRVTTDETAVCTSETDPAFNWRRKSHAVADCVQDRLETEVNHTASQSALRHSFESIDKDYDGRLSLDEFRARMPR